MGLLPPVVVKAARVGAALALVGCGPALPEPDTPGARVLQVRCGGCHRPFAPQTMTSPMWDYQIQRMRLLFSQRGMPWLPPEEERLLREYLARHAATG